MVASLQNKKEALEAKLRDKTSELRKLCIEEAELTGILPVETPIEPGEGPPQFRRRVGTAFTYPESLINKLRSKEDEALAALELECKIQTGIAEAALGLANDLSASKSVRRKHRVLFEESQRRLSELESKLSTLKQSQPKHKKKPRPHAEPEDCVDGDFEEVPDNFRHPALTTSLSDRCTNSSMRHSHTYGGLVKQDQQTQSFPQRMVQSHIHLPTADYRHSVLEHHQHLVRSTNPSPIDHNNAVWWSKGRDNWQYNTTPHHSQYVTHSPDQYSVETSYNYNERFGSLDRNAMATQTIDPDNRVSFTLPRNAYVPHSNTLILLPSQTYPENSLMRTQSLGNMDNLKQHPDRKSKEKEWYETSLDSSPSKPSTVPPEPPHPVKSPEGKSSPLFTNSPTTAIPETNQASVNSIHFDTVVPYESPKNHTVIQAGKWQPYREVTKPFEMSDFYKYSTKFRQAKSQTQNQNQVPSRHQEQTAGQQKVIYKPLQPLECQPLSGNSDGSKVKNVPQNNSPQQLENYSPTDWYHSKNMSKPRSSTLV